MGRLISWIALGFFIVVVPFISWYYLKQGFNYRRALMAEVVPKDSIPVLQDTFGLLRGKTTVFSKNGFRSDTLIVTGLKSQFEKVVDFQILAGDSTSSTPKLSKFFLDNYFNKYGDNQIVLIDTAMRIRNVYESDKESIKKLVEHIAIILPKPKDVDIEMKKK